MGMKQKKNFFFEKKIQNGRLKKSSFFKIANSQNFFAKISQIRPWVSRIEWCEGHWCSSTYMAVRLSDKSSKTASILKNALFLSRPFWIFFFKIFFFFAFFPWKLVKVYWLARMAQNFDQAKRDNTFWPTPNILGGSVNKLQTFSVCAAIFVQIGVEKFKMADSKKVQFSKSPILKIFLWKFPRFQI